MIKSGYPRDARIFQCMQINQCDISFCCIVQLLYHVQLFVTPWTAALQASLSLTISQSLLKLLSIESMMSSNHLILCHPHLLLSSIFPNIRVFSNESAVCFRRPIPIPKAKLRPITSGSASVLPMNI